MPRVGRHPSVYEHYGLRWFRRVGQEPVESWPWLMDQSTNWRNVGLPTCGPRVVTIDTTTCLISSLGLKYVKNQTKESERSRHYLTRCKQNTYVLIPVHTGNFVFVHDRPLSRSPSIGLPEGINVSVCPTRHAPLYPGHLSHRDVDTHSKRTRSISLV